MPTRMSAQNCKDLENFREEKILVIDKMSRGQSSSVQTFSLIKKQKSEASF